MTKLNIVIAASFVTGCHTYIPVAVRCEPPKDIVESCPQPEASFVRAATKSKEPEEREQALIHSIADMKQKFEICSAKQVGLTDLLNSCNQIVDRTVAEVKKLK